MSREQKALMEATKGNSLTLWKCMNKTVHLTEKNKTEENLITSNTVKTLHVQRWYLAYGKRCYCCEKANKFEKVHRSQSRQTPRDDNRWRVVQDTYQNNEETAVAIHEINLLRSKVFNLHSIRSVLIAKLKKTSSQKKKCLNKLHTGSDGNLMPIRMYKVPFLQTNIDEINKSRNKKIVFCAYNNSCISQMDICHITVLNKCFEYQCSFFVVPGNRPALLGMPGCEWLKLLTVNFQTQMTNTKSDKLMKKPKQDKSKTKY